MGGEKRILKVSFNKSGGTASANGVTTRVTLPTSWVKEMGLNESSREIIATFENGTISIAPKNLEE